ADAHCPRCYQEEEDSNHVFRGCPTTTEVWRLLKFSWILNNNLDSVWNWLTWVFSQWTNEQCRLFCCGLWIIWTSRNRFIYENKYTTSRDISFKISDFILELRGVEEKKLNLAASGGPKFEERRTSVEVYFDAAFDNNSQNLPRGWLSETREEKYWHPSQSENIYAHLVAAEALKKGEGHYMVGDVPNTVRRAVERERPRHLD
ncbi:hypothetical protein Golob_027637, partial [Gossypium lobatum]|nr:hypothetical protein [Gossypium lobatum]